MMYYTHKKLKIKPNSILKLLDIITRMSTTNQTIIDDTNNIFSDCVDEEYIPICMTKCKIIQNYFNNVKNNMKTECVDEDNSIYI